MSDRGNRPPRRFADPSAETAVPARRRWATHPARPPGFLTPRVRAHRAPARIRAPTPGRSPSRHAPPAALAMPAQAGPYPTGCLPFDSDVPNWSWQMMDARGCGCKRGGKRGAAGWTVVGPWLGRGWAVVGRGWPWLAVVGRGWAEATGGPAVWPRVCRPTVPDPGGK